MRFEKVKNFDSVKAFPRLLSSTEFPSAGSLNPDSLINQWILSVIGDRVTPLKIEWLDQDFAGAIKQQQIDAIIASCPHEEMSNNIDELMRLDMLVSSTIIPDKPPVELYISLTDMLLSLDMQSVHEGQHKTSPNRTRTYNPSLNVFFKVFNVGEIGFLKVGKSATIYILRWIFKNIELLKTQDVTALLIDNFQDIDRSDLDAIVEQLEVIQNSGLPLCFLQSDPPQVLGMNELNGIVGVLSHVDFVVRGLLPGTHRSLHSSIKKNVVKNKKLKFELAQKRKTCRRFGFSTKQLFLVDNFFDSAIDSNNIRKIFTLKLAGLTSVQISRVFIITDQPKFQSIKQSGSPEISHSWSPSVISSMLDSFYMFQKNIRNEIHKQLLDKKISYENDLSKIISESIFCLAIQPLIISNPDFGDAPIKVSRLLTDVLSSKIFCTCDMYQEFFNEDKEKLTTPSLFLIHHRICDCVGIRPNQDESEDYIKDLILRLTLKAPRISDLHGILNTELNMLIENSNKVISSLKPGTQKNNITNSIDLYIGIIVRKISWLSSSEIELRLCQFHTFLCKDTLEKVEALKFIELAQKLIASIFLDAHTGFIKVYWSHSLEIPEIKVDK